MIRLSSARKNSSRPFRDQVGYAPPLFKTALPPGKICGQRWVASPCASSVTGVSAPPAEEIRDSTLPPEVSAAMMLPSSPQQPPRATAPTASPKVTAAPPSTEIFFSLLPAKNATHCPSGEKKGAYAPSVPAISVALG